jgi:hypothetical protein
VGDTAKALQGSQTSSMHRLLDKAAFNTHQQLGSINNSLPTHGLDTAAPADGHDGGQLQSNTLTSQCCDVLAPTRTASIEPVTAAEPQQHTSVLTSLQANWFVAATCLRQAAGPVGQPNQHCGSAKLISTKHSTRIHTVCRTTVCS